MNDNKRQLAPEPATPEQCRHFWAQASAVMANFAREANRYMLDTVGEDGVDNSVKEEVLEQLRGASTSSDAMFGASMRVVTEQQRYAAETATQESNRTYAPQPSTYQQAAPYGQVR